MTLTYDFTGKVVLITGSGTGMGAAIATLFAHSGARVVIADVNSNGMRQVADECARVSPGALKPLQVMVDLRRDVEMERLIQTTITEFGKLDILVNNVGVCYSSHIDDDDYIEKQRATFEVNVQPMIQLTQLSVDHLSRTKGCIINISSISGVKPVSYMLLT
jgi:meso-butanediol dehydrogenase/(S,S)-butanediol dehydrogenase/diacetyl reductase